LNTKKLGAPIFFFFDSLSEGLYWNLSDFDEDSGHRPSLSLKSFPENPLPIGEKMIKYD
jgi:hypothetical protein